MEEMGKIEEIYLADMRSDRKMECGGSGQWIQSGTSRGHEE